MNIATGSGIFDLLFSLLFVRDGDKSEFVDGMDGSLFNTRRKAAAINREKKGEKVEVFL